MNQFKSFFKELFTEADNFQARSKETGKLVNFKSKASMDAALKAGSHENPNAPKGGKTGGKDSKKDVPKVNIFDKPKEEPKSQSSSPKSDLDVDKVVYNTRTKTVGIVRMADERGETKTDADGNVNTSELEPYNPMKYPHQKDAKVAPSTKKEVESRNLWDPFTPSKSDEPKKDEPKADTPASQPKQQRKGNPQVNIAAKKGAEEAGITPQILGNEKYKKVMYQAAVEALTDSNYHDEARELIAKLEGKPEWAKKPEYPSMDDPQYNEKMKALKTTGVDSSEYWDYSDKTGRFARKVSNEASWDGAAAVDGIAFTLRMNGFHKEADMIQSVIKESVTRLTTIIKETTYSKKKFKSLINEVSEPEVISQLKDIVKNKQYQDVKDPKTGKKMKVDMQTANAVVQIYDGLSNVNKDNMVKMGLPKMIEVSYKIIGKYK
jgi:hypothetical protein